jgi:multidrug efflux system membrane fusion protein
MLFAGCESRRLDKAVMPLACVLLISLTGCRDNKQAAKPAAAPAIVTAAKAVQGDAPNFLEGIGRVRALKAVNIKPRVTGLLLRAEFKAGDEVNKGQLLFTIDPAPFDAKVKEAEAKVRGSEAQFMQAEADLKRFETLFREKTISPEQFELKLLDMKSKKFVHELHEAELETARLDLGYCRIESPVDGHTGDVSVDDGNTVAAYQDTLTTVRQMRPIRVEFSVPGKFLEQIRRGAGQERLEAQAVPSAGGAPEIGDLTLIDNQVNPKTGMLMLEATFPNQDTRLWPGDFVKVKLKLEVAKNAVMIPSSAVSDGASGKYVWIVKDGGIVDIRPVSIARRLDSMDVVSDGLRAGETVVAEGQFSLSPGARVAVKEPAAQSTPRGDHQDAGKQQGGRP